MGDSERMRVLEEVAAEFHMTPRRLREAIKALRVPVLKRGRIVLFDDFAIAALQAAMRQYTPGYSAKSISSSYERVMQELQWMGKRPPSSRAALRGRLDAALGAPAPRSSRRRRLEKEVEELLAAAPREKKHR